MTVSERRVSLGEMTLHVRSIDWGGAAGSRGVLVFLHDSLGCVETWRDFPQRLAQRAGMNALIYDRRGYGRSSPFGADPRTPLYLHREAEVLFELLTVLGINRASLFGHSDGGSIAILAAAQQPDRVEAIITEGAHVFVEEITLAGIREARVMLERGGLFERLQRYHGVNTAGLTAAWTGTWLSPEFRDWNIESSLPRVECPALVIQGADDEYGTQAQVDAIVRGAGALARALSIPGSGHTPHRDAAETVIEASAAFLVSCGQNP